MTEREFNIAINSIWKKACAEMHELIKTQNVKIFDSDYNFHQYVKRGLKDGIIRSGRDAMRRFISKRETGLKNTFVVATPDKIAAEREKCRESELNICRQLIEYSKNCIIDNEIKIRKLLKEKRKNHDHRRKTRKM